MCRPAFRPAMIRTQTAIGSPGRRPAVTTSAPADACWCNPHRTFPPGPLTAYEAGRLERFGCCCPCLCCPLRLDLFLRLHCPLENRRRHRRHRRGHGGRPPRNGCARGWWWQRVRRDLKGHLGQRVYLLRRKLPAAAQRPAAQPLMQLLWALPPIPKQRRCQPLCCLHPAALL
jgi:hypothetical protein